MISARQPRASSSDQTWHSSQRSRVNRWVSGAGTGKSLARRDQAAKSAVRSIRSSPAEQPRPLARARRLAELESEDVDLGVQLAAAARDLPLLLLELQQLRVTVHRGDGARSEEHTSE